MKSNNAVYHFYLSENLEYITPIFGIFPDIEFLGIDKKSFKPVGDMFLSIFNNFDEIVNILIESKKQICEPFYLLTDFLDTKLRIINRELAQIISKEVDSYLSNEVKAIKETQFNLKHTEKELKEHYDLLNNDELYNQYYDELINDTKKRIQSTKNENVINSEKDFLNYLYHKKSNEEDGKKEIKSIIKDLKEDKKQYRKELRNLNELPKLLDEYISKLINTFINYKYYIDLYYGFLEESDLKDKDISYFQSIFGIDFEIPRYFIYACFEKNKKILPLKDLVLSLYSNTKTKKETPRELYKKILKTTNNLNRDNKIIYIKSYEIYALKDIFNIYFNYFIESNIYIRKCKNCNKYFIPQNRSDEVYCNNKSPQNPNKTCKEYGAKKTYRDEIKSIPIKYEHNKTSQYFRMKINRAKTQKEKELYKKKFDLYKENYQKKKQKYQSHRLEEADFVEWIKNQKDLQ